MSQKRRVLGRIVSGRELASSRPARLGFPVSRRIQARIYREHADARRCRGTAGALWVAFCISVRRLDTRRLRERGDVLSSGAPDEKGARFFFHGSDCPAVRPLPSACLPQIFQTGGNLDL